jgi:putative FmdB family regulatory protein
MPIYEYECTKCGCRTEAVQKIGDPPLKKCKSCGGPLKKVLSSPAIHFKGSGWYVTDYARKSSPDGEATPKDKKPQKKPCAPETSSEKAPPTSTEK